MSASRSLVLPAFVLAIFATSIASADTTNTPAQEGGKLRAWCKEHPEQCAKKREEMRTKCQADPQKCDQAKEKWRERKNQQSNGNN